MNLRVFYLYKTVGFGWLRNLTGETRNLIQLDANFKNWIRNKKDQMRFTGYP